MKQIRKKLSLPLALLVITGAFFYSIPQALAQTANNYLYMNGNVGIGTTKPSYKLQVAPSGEGSGLGIGWNALTGGTGETDLYNYGQGGGGGFAFYNYPSNGNSYPTSGATNLMNILSNGFVGIGTPSPSQKLQVESGNILLDNGMFTLNNPNGGWNDNDQINSLGAIAFRPDADNSGDSFVDFLSGANSSVAMRINTTSGNVGIGTTNPTLGKLQLDTSGDIPYLDLDTTATSNKRTRLNFSQNSTLGMEIGTDYSMNNTNDLYIYNRASGQAAAYFNPGSNVWLSARNTNSDFYINSSGNVGIGTTNPPYKLEVAGDVRANGGWLRTTGNAGWYNDSYGGGWYMQDGTWIRSYGGKPVYMDTGFDTGNPAAVGCGGGLGAGYTFRTCGTQMIQGTYGGDFPGLTLVNGGNTAGDFNDIIWRSQSGSEVARIYQTSAGNSFRFVSAGPIMFNTGITGATGSNERMQIRSDGYVEFCCGSGGYSKKSLKENFTTIDKTQILNKIDQLPIMQWNYKTNPASDKHIGPFAEDFYSAFGLNNPDQDTISTIDEAGVTLAGVQALSQQVKDLQSKNTDLEKQNQDLTSELHNLEERVSKLEER